MKRVLIVLSTGLLIIVLNMGVSMLLGSVFPGLRAEYQSSPVFRKIIYWIITIPGMIISYTSFEVSGLMVMQWTLGNLIQALCAGLMFARFLP